MEGSGGDKWASRGREGRGGDAPRDEAEDTIDSGRGGGGGGCFEILERERKKKKKGGGKELESVQMPYRTPAGAGTIKGVGGGKRQCGP